MAKIRDFYHPYASNDFIKIDGPGTHILKGDKECSVGLLVFSEDALFNAQVKKPFWFWQKEPEIFNLNSRV